MFTNILVPVDGSKSALIALDKAVDGYLVPAISPALPEETAQTMLDGWRHGGKCTNRPPVGVDSVAGTPLRGLWRVRSTTDPVR